MAKVLIVGCGSLGYPLAELMADAGHQVTAIKRHTASKSSNKFKIIIANITVIHELEALETDFEHIFFIVSADGRDPQSYRDIYGLGMDNVLNKFAQAGSHAPWIFVSSTSVYGQKQGEWVDEDSVTEPNKNTSQLILQAEQKLKQSNPANIIVRFSGIYGPGREYLLRMAKQTPSIQQYPPYFTNRIHQQDCIGFLLFLFERRLSGIQLEQCYLASDNDPAPLWDVINWLAGQLRSHPPSVKAAEPDVDMNKRCSNEKLKKLGYRFTYPDYKSGYLELIHQVR